MNEIRTLKPAAELARINPVQIPNESAEYRAARTALLAEEIELRRHIERVAAQRRALPPGGPVIGDYRFEGEDGPIDFAGLFGDKETLAIYSYMFGPAARASLPDVHQSFGRLGGQRGRHRAEDLARGGRALADRAPDRLETGARLARPPPLQRSQRRLFARLFRRSCRTAPRSRPSTCSPAATARSAISGRARWRTSPPTRARTRAARPIPRRCGWCSTRRPKGGGVDWYPKLDYV